jgi:soluble lytic murein transglycosylase
MGSMSRRLVLGLMALAIIVLVIPLLLFPHPGGEPVVREHVEGDVAEVVDRAAIDGLPDMARSLLATDRPWRAARTMRRYLEAVPEAPIDYRLLAARAEAAWGGWPRVHELLDGVAGLDALESGLGLYLLGRARDERDDYRGAADAYRAFLDSSPPGGDLDRERAAAQLRLGLALVRLGDRDGAESRLSPARG